MKQIFSFGFRHGKPIVPDALIIDVRGIDMRNPYQHPGLRDLRGDHPEVISYIERGKGLKKAYALLLEHVKRHPGPVYLGCTGGHHRSVYLANRLAKDLQAQVTHLNYSDK